LLHSGCGSGCTRGESTRCPRVCNGKAGVSPGQPHPNHALRVIQRRLFERHGDLPSCWRRGQIAGQQLNDTYDIFKFTISAASPPAAGASVAIISATPFNLSLFGAQRQSLGLAAGYMGQTSLSLAGLAPGDYYLQVTHYVLGLSGSFEYSLAFDVGAAAE